MLSLMTPTKRVITVKYSDVVTSQPSTFENSNAKVELNKFYRWEIYQYLTVFSLNLPGSQENMSKPMATYRDSDKIKGFDTSVRAIV